MSIHEAGLSVFNPRVSALLNKEHITEKSLTNINKFPKVLQRFYLITPHALLVLDREHALFNELDEHFTKSEHLNMGLLKWISSKSLYVNNLYLNSNSSNYYVDFQGPEKEPIFMGLHGSSNKEAILLRKMINDFSGHQTFSDFALIFKYCSGAELTTTKKLDDHQFSMLTNIFNSDVLSSIRQKNITRVILDNGGKLGSNIKLFEEGSSTILIPIYSLRDNPIKTTVLLRTALTLIK